jgi:hypothetical protein
LTSSPRTAPLPESRSKTRAAPWHETWTPELREHDQRSDVMLKFLGGTVGVIFLIGLLVVIGLLALIF